MDSTRQNVDEDQATVLVVDDSRLSARKLALAMRTLGHRAEVAESGREALDLAEQTAFDVVLLDIVMPEMDGYEVLRRLKADDRLRHIPVIVVSSLDDEIESVVKAIELGAEDFLPKEFEPAILRARLNASLARKRYRDRELEDMARIEQLTRAAQVIENGAFHPSDLDVDHVAERNDAIGRLASVFRGLADEVYYREQRLDQNVRTFRGIVLVVLAGLLIGIRPSLAKIITAADVPVLAAAFWSSLVGGLFCLACALAVAGWPRFRLEHLRFLLAWALILGCGYQVALIMIADVVEATVISVVASSRAFLVFGLAAIIALERPSTRRLSGLIFGFAAVALILLVHGTVIASTEPFWMAATLVLPLLLAVHTLQMSYRPLDLGAFAATGAMLMIATILIAPVAHVGDALIWPGLGGTRAWILISVLGVATGLAFVVGLEVVRIAGPVFAGQMAYTQTLAGIAWAMLLLGEQPTTIIWLAVALVIVGFLLVEPKRAGDEFRATLSRERLMRNQ